MELTDKNYGKIIKNNDKPVLVDFYSPTCEPCRMLRQLIDERLSAYAAENDVEIVTCDISKNSKLADAFKVRFVPFTIAVIPDGKLKYTELGLKNETYYFELIDKLA